jgi:S1-C subfamily serine protease
MRRTTRMLLLFSAAMLLHCGHVWAQALTAQEIARRALGSTVVLVLEDDLGNTVSLGTGFFVRKGEVASSLHVMDGATRGYAKLVGRKDVHDIEGVIAADQEQDLVVLKVSADSTPPLPLGDSDGVQVGDPVYLVGNPHGLEGTFAQGVVSGIREAGQERVLQVTAPISPGCSGGPVLDGRGEVVGLAAAMVRNGQNLNFAISSNALRALLEMTGPSRPIAHAGSSISSRPIWQVWVNSALRPSPKASSRGVVSETGPR